MHYSAAQCSAVMQSWCIFVSDDDVNRDDEDDGDDDDDDIDEWR